MSLIVLSDIHIGLNKDNSIFYDTTRDLFNEIYDIANRKDIDTIAILGDIFHSRKVITQRALDALKDIINIMSDKTLILVRGNHDTYYDEIACPNWLTHFRQYKNVITVEDGPYYWSDNIVFVPWKPDLNAIMKNSIVCGHFSINSFKMNEGFECYNSRFNISDFKQFQHVLSGHFHLPSSKSNITYLGSAFQHDFGDENSSRGYYIFNGNLKFFEFTSAPKFYTINTSTLSKQKHLIKNNIIKLVFDKDFGVEKNFKIIESIELMQPKSLSIDLSKLSDFESLTCEAIDTDVMKTDEELLFDFVRKQTLPEHININVLSKVIQMLLKSIKELES